MKDENVQKKHKWSYLKASFSSNLILRKAPKYLPQNSGFLLFLCFSQSSLLSSLLLQNLSLSSPKTPPPRPAWRPSEKPPSSSLFPLSLSLTAEPPSQAKDPLKISPGSSLTASHSCPSPLPCSCHPQRFSAFSAERNLHVSSFHWPSKPLT